MLVLHSQLLACVLSETVQIHYFFCTMDIYHPVVLFKFSTKRRPSPLPLAVHLGNTVIVSGAQEKPLERRIVSQCHSHAVVLSITSRGESHDLTRFAFLRVLSFFYKLEYKRFCWELWRSRCTRVLTVFLRASLASSACKIFFFFQSEHLNIKAIY